MRTKLYSFLSIVLATLVQCKDPYDFKTLDNPGLVIVSGYISDQLGPYPLFLGMTLSAKRTYPLPLLNAHAYLTDDQGNTEVYVEKGNGSYELPGAKITGRPMGSYQLNFTLQDGRSYQSTIEIMPTASKAVDDIMISAVKVKVLGFEGVPVDRYQVSATMNTSLERTTNRYCRWSVEEYFSIFPTCLPGAVSCPPICYIHAPYSPYYLNVVDWSNYSDLSIRGIQLVNRDIDYTFSSRHYFCVTQFGMNASCYTYWKKVQELILKNGSIFDKPPATIHGNINNVANPNEIVLGYFEASTVQITRKFIDRGAINYFIQSCVVYDPDYTFGLAYCNNCLTLPGSSKDAPSWFW